MIDHVESSAEVDIHGIDILVSEVGIFNSIYLHPQLSHRVMVCSESFLCMGEDVIVFCPVDGGCGKVPCPNFIEDTG